MTENHNHLELQNWMLFLCALVLGLSMYHNGLIASNGDTIKIIMCNISWTALFAGFICSAISFNKSVCSLYLCMAGYFFDIVAIMSFLIMIWM